MYSGGRDGAHPQGKIQLESSLFSACNQARQKCILSSKISENFKGHYLIKDSLKVINYSTVLITSSYLVLEFFFMPLPSLFLGEIEAFHI